MRISVVIKLFAIFTFSTAFIFSVIYFGSEAYARFGGENDTYAEGTKIGPHDISEQTKTQVAALLENSVAQWEEETNITFQYKERSYEISHAIFEFNIEETLNRIVDSKSNTVYTDIREQQLETELKKTSTSIETTNVNIEKLVADLLASVSTLQASSQTIPLEKYISNDNQTVISKVSIPVETLQGEMTLLVQSLSTIEVKEQSLFSLLSYLEEIGKNAYSKEALSILATGLYEAILPTNFSIIERHISAELPGYAQLGYEAKIADEWKMDLVFENSNKTPYTFELSMNGNQLEVILRGSTFLYKYDVVQEGKENFEPETIVQFDPKLAFAQKRIVDHGKEGWLIRTFRETTDESGRVIKKEQMSEDFYAPVYRKEVRSLIAPVIVETPVEQEEEDLNAEEASNEIGVEDNEVTNEVDGSVNVDANQNEDNDAEEQSAEDIESEQSATQSDQTLQ